MTNYSQMLEVSIQIGKNGVTPGVVEEIKRHLRSKKVIKIKFLRNFSEHGIIDDAATLIGEQAGAKVKQKVGRVIILERQEN